LGQNQLAGFRAVPVARYADEVQPQRQRKVPDQIRQKHHRPAEQRNDHQIAPGEIAFDLVRQLADPTGDLGLRNEDATQLVPPARWRARAIRHPFDPDPVVQAFFPAKRFRESRAEASEKMWAAGGGTTSTPWLPAGPRTNEPQLSTLNFAL